MPKPERKSSPASAFFGQNRVRVYLTGRATGLEPAAHELEASNQIGTVVKILIPPAIEEVHITCFQALSAVRFFREPGRGKKKAAGRKDWLPVTWIVDLKT